MRLAAVARRKKEMSETNYNRILTNDRMNKEEKIEKRKRVNVDIRKEIKIQVSLIVSKILFLFRSL